MGCGAILGGELGRGSAVGRPWVGCGGSDSKLGRGRLSYGEPGRSGSSHRARLSHRTVKVWRAAGDELLPVEVAGVKTLLRVADLALWTLESRDLSRCISSKAMLGSALLR